MEDLRCCYSNAGHEQGQVDGMDQEYEVVAQELREFDFDGDLLHVAIVDGIPYVAIRPICEFLQIDWSSQYRRLQEDEVLDVEKRLIVFQPQDDQRREMVALPLEYMHGWLFSITVSRLKKPTPEMIEKIQHYRRSCFKVLWNHFGAALHQQPTTTPASQAVVVLEAVRNQSLAIAQMAEQQIELQNQVQVVNARVDRAAEVVSDIKRRLTAVEHRVVPVATISDAQAAEISMLVKALADLLSQQDKSKNHYQSIFAELYRRFEVSSYKRIRLEQYQEVIDFLTDWHKRLQ
jgi:hypothetical protein